MDVEDPIGDLPIWHPKRQGRGGVATCDWENWENWLFTWLRSTTYVYTWSTWFCSAVVILWLRPARMQGQDDIQLVLSRQFQHRFQHIAYIVNLLVHLLAPFPKWLGEVRESIKYICFHTDRADMLVHSTTVRSRACKGIFKVVVAAMLGWSIRPKCLIPQTGMYGQKSYKS